MISLPSKVNDLSTVDLTIDFTQEGIQENEISNDPKHWAGNFSPVPLMIDSVSNPTDTVTFYLGSCSSGSRTVISGLLLILRPLMISCLVKVTINFL